AGQNLDVEGGDRDHAAGGRLLVGLDGEQRCDGPEQGEVDRVREVDHRVERQGAQTADDSQSGEQTCQGAADGDVGEGGRSAQDAVDVGARRVDRVGGDDVGKGVDALTGAVVDGARVTRADLHGAATRTGDAGAGEGRCGGRGASDIGGDRIGNQ